MRFTFKAMLGKRRPKSSSPKIEEEKRMSKRKIALIFLLVFLILGTSYAGVKKSSRLAKPTYPGSMFDIRYHDVGQLYLPITNYGIHGHEVATGSAGGVWPKGTGQTYIFGAGIWIGAIKEGGKYVSCGYNPNSGASELVPGFILDPTHEYKFDVNNVRVLMSTDYPHRMEELNLPDWPFGYYNPETHDTVKTWAEAGEGYQPVTVSVQDSYAWFSDVDQSYKFDTSAKILNVQITQIGYAWNYPFNEDYVFLTYDIKNASEDTLKQAYLAVICDPDIGSAGDDMVGFDKERNMAYVYDFDGQERGWGTPPGYLGYDFLESPVDPATGEQRGLTAFRIFTIDVDPKDDRERYDTISADGVYDVDTSPADKRFAMPTGPFDIAPGETKRVVIGIICAKDLETLQAADDLAQTMYDLGWKCPEPPPIPMVTAVPGDGKVTLYWDDLAEECVDPVSGEKDFEGYRIYKSRTGLGGLGNWAPADPTKEWTLIAQFDKKNGITQLSPINPDDLYDPDHPNDKYLGEDTGLVHSFVDTDVINGVEYHYAVTAYDHGTPVVPSLETGLILGKNRVSVRPGFYTLGYKPTTVNIRHISGFSTAYVQVEELNPDLVKDQVYRLTIDDTSFAEKVFTLTTAEGEVIFENATTLHGEDNNIFDGLRLIITDVTKVELDKAYWTTTEGEVSDVNYAFELLPQANPIPANYQVRFTDEGDTTKFRRIPVPFQIWNTSYNTKVKFEIFQNSPQDTTAEMLNSWTSGDKITLIENIAGRDLFTWVFVITAPEKDPIPPQTGDVLNVCLKIPLTSEDVYELTVQAPTAKVTSKSQLEKIKVVPNPYIVRNVWELSPNYSRIQFINLPERCTIRIYTLAGDLIRVLEHGDGENEGPGWEWWDVLTANNQKVASGVYIYHVDVPGVGDHIGKMAVITSCPRF